MAEEKVSHEPKMLPHSLVLKEYIYIHPNKILDSKIASINK